MHVYGKVYELAASAGAFEGYVYRKDKVNPDYLPDWVGHLVSAYKNLEPEILEKIQPSLDQTLGRAVRSLLPVFGEDHDIIQELKSIIAGPLPETADDFQKEKWFEEE